MLLLFSLLCEGTVKIFLIKKLGGSGLSTPPLIMELYKYYKFFAIEEHEKPETTVLLNQQYYLILLNKTSRRLDFFRKRKPYKKIETLILNSNRNTTSFFPLSAKYYE